MSQKYKVHCPNMAGQRYQLNEIVGKFDDEGEGDTLVHQTIVDDFQHYSSFRFEPVKPASQAAIDTIKGAAGKLKDSLTKKKKSEGLEPDPATDQVPREDDPETEDPAEDDSDDDTDPNPDPKESTE